MPSYFAKWYNYRCEFSVTFGIIRILISCVFKCKMVSDYCGFHLYGDFLCFNKIEHFHVYLFISFSSPVKYTFTTFAHLSFSYWFMGVLHIFWRLILCVANTFSQFLTYFFSFIMVPFKECKQYSLSHFKNNFIYSTYFFKEIFINQKNNFPY